MLDKVHKTALCKLMFKPVGVVIGGVLLQPPLASSQALCLMLSASRLRDIPSELQTHDSAQRNMDRTAATAQLWDSRGPELPIATFLGGNSASKYSPKYCAQCRALRGLTRMFAIMGRIVACT